MISAKKTYFIRRALVLRNVGRGAARTSRRHRAGRVGNSGTNDTIRAANRQHGPAAHRQHRSTPDGQHDPTAERLRKRKPGSDSERPECAGRQFTAFYDESE